MFPSQLMKLEALPWLILFLPLLAAGIITLLKLRDRKTSAPLRVSPENSAPSTSPSGQEGSLASAWALPFTSLGSPR